MPSHIERESPLQMKEKKTTEKHFKLRNGLNYFT